VEELLTPHPLPPLADSGLDLELGEDLGAKLHFTFCKLSQRNLVEKVNAKKIDFR
jgi:hypothetical protein